MEAEPSTITQLRRRLLPDNGSWCLVPLLVYLISMRICGILATPVHRCEFTPGPYLGLTSCNLEKISREDMRRAPFARIVDFENNNITMIEYDAFAENRMLQVLKLGLNRFLQIDDNKCFIHSKSIETIELADNPQLGVVQPAAFQCAPKLTRLDLTGNNKCHLTRRLFKKVNSKILVLCSADASDEENPSASPTATTRSALDPERDPTINPPVGWNLKTLGPIFLVIGIVIMLIVIAVCLFKKQQLFSNWSTDPDNIISRSTVPDKFVEEDSSHYEKKKLQIQTGSYLDA